MRSVYMRNDANTFNHRLPFDIVVTDESAFTAWYRRTLETLPNAATQGEFRLPHVWQLDPERHSRVARGPLRGELVTARVWALEWLGRLLYRLRRLNSSWDFGRASGECVCTLCNRPYRKHPFSEHRSYDDQPFLHRLCNGRLVKL